MRMLPLLADQVRIVDILQSFCNEIFVALFTAEVAPEMLKEFDLLLEVLRVLAYRVTALDLLVRVVRFLLFHQHILPHKLVTFRRLDL